MMETLELGIDEAGRGPVLGPLVMAGVWVPEDRMLDLIDWGIKDSKKFGSQKKGKENRRLLAERIRSEFQHDIVVVNSVTIDKYVRQNGLNRLEREVAESIIRKTFADRVVLDGASLFQSLTNQRVFAFNKADNDYISVAAASILAKDRRDMELEALCSAYTEEYGPIGGNGYANLKTLEFVNWYRQKFGDFPDFYRRSYNWKAIAGD